MAAVLVLFIFAVFTWPVLCGRQPANVDAALASSVATNQDPQFGMAIGNVLTRLPAAQLATELHDIRSLGVTWIRYDINWGDVQPTSATSYSWGPYDRVVSAVNAAGLHSLATIAYTPLWAREANCRSVGDTCPPANPAAFATFAAAVASRYAPWGVHTWEIWNEPNVSTFWKPAPDPQAYTTLLKDAATSIRAHDSKAVILVGGLTGSLSTGTSIAAISFLQSIYADGGKNSFDAVAMHPYTYPYSSTYPTVYSWREMADAPTNLRAIMEANGDSSKKIWITEYGAPTDGPGTELSEDSNTPIAQINYVSESLQAQLLVSAVQQYETYPWAGPFFWYSYKDLGTNTDTRENFFGLVRADGTHKPAYAAYQQAISSATGQ